MTRTEAAVLALRLAGLYLMLGTLLQLSDVALYTVIWADHDGALSDLLGYVIWLLLRSLGGVVLFLAAPSLARTISDGDEPMRLEDHFAIGAIAIRLGAIVLWDAALALLPMIERRGFHLDPMYVVVPVASMLVLSGVSTWLFVSADTIGARLFGPRAALPETTSTARLASIAFSAVGLWILASNLPGFARSSASLITLGVDEAFGSRPGWLELLASGLRIALGTFLFLGAGGVVHVWHKLSVAGLHRGNGAA